MSRIYEPEAYDTGSWPESWWKASADDLADFASLDGETTADVAIIGAGYTGLNAALELVEQHGLDVVILEAGQPGWGASGRNGGFCCIGGSALGEPDIQRKFGMDAAREFYAFQTGAIERVADNLQSYGIDADKTGTGEMAVAHSPKAFAALKAEAAQLKTNYGVEHQIYEPAALKAEGISSAAFYGGMRSPHGFGLHPLKYARGLARQATKIGVRIYGSSPVSALQNDNGLALKTPNGQIRAKQVLIATNGYSDEAVPPFLHGRTLPTFSSIILTPPLSDSQLKAQNWSSDVMTYDTRHLLHYFRLLPDRRFMFGLRGAIGASAPKVAAARLRAQREFREMFPAWRDITPEFFWSGLVCLTARMTPFVGELTDLQGVHAALGYHGNGVAAASEAGRLAAKLMAGGLKDSELPDVMRKPLRRFPLPRFRRQMLAARYAAFKMEDRWS